MGNWPFFACFEKNDVFLTASEVEVCANQIQSYMGVFVWPGPAGLVELHLQASKSDLWIVYNKNT